MCMSVTHSSDAQQVRLTFVIELEDLSGVVRLLAPHQVVSWSQRVTCSIGLICSGTLLCCNPQRELSARQQLFQCSGLRRWTHRICQRMSTSISPCMTLAVYVHPAHATTSTQADCSWQRTIDGVGHIAMHCLRNFVIGQEDIRAHQDLDRNAHPHASRVRAEPALADSASIAVAAQITTF